MEYKGKVVYFADAMETMKIIESEYRDIQRGAHFLGLELPDAEIVTVPPMIGSGNEKSYDLLFFDWGGMSMGNSMMNSFIRQIVGEAKGRPNTEYVMTSLMTEDAYRDFLEEVEDDKPFNVFGNIKEFVDNFKKYNE